MDLVNKINESKEYPTLDKIKLDSSEVKNQAFIDIIYYFMDGNFNKKTYRRIFTNDSLQSDLLELNEWVYKDIKIWISKNK